MTPLDYYLWRAVSDKCYTDKPKKIDALKDNIREDLMPRTEMHKKLHTKKKMCFFKRQKHHVVFTGK